MIILAIETSCDETAVSLLEANETASGTEFLVHANITHTQIDVHREFGGVFPALAKREHQRNLVPILLRALLTLSAGTEPANPTELDEILSREPELLAMMREHVSGMNKPPVDAICVTSGPGLEPALWVGINFAKALGLLWGVPVIPVNHMEGHILSVLVPPLLAGEGQGVRFEYDETSIAFPSLALLVSGGHTELVLAKGVGDYEIVGKTRDDAVGEAFDKVARILGLPYPGGPEVSKLAQEARDTGAMKHAEFPRPMIHSKDYDFSFSGLKTAVLYFVKKIQEDAADFSEESKRDVAREFEEAAVDVIVSKTKRAVEEFGARTLIVGGGVAANSWLKKKLSEEIDLPAERIKFPARELATDNSLMIALAGYFKIKKSPDAAYGDIRADGNWSL